MFTFFKIIKDETCNCFVETSCHVCRFITQETIDFVSEKNIYVRVLAGINVVTREARWEFQSLDPQTGQFLSRDL